MSETIEPLIVVGVDGSNHSKEALHWAVASAAGTSPGVPVFRRVEQGSPAQVSVDASEEACPAVVGTRGHGGFKGALLGSVSQQVVQYAGSTVVVVREGEADD
ncbi:universal stress protein [Streptomyces sp. NPDC050448]|uniref:universal stress protein n=1 Tax=Streptomyces sp. NPDC050448 TaxID=3155404 RepID=UPI003435AE5B